MKKEIKFLVFLYFIIVIVKVIFSSFIPTISIFSDEYLYAKMARSFFYHGEFSIHGIPTSQYLPLYPIFLSVAYLFQDMQLVYLAMKVINAFISSTIIFPAYFLTRAFTKPLTAKFTTLLIGIIPATFAFTPYLMSENLFYPLVLFSVYFLYKNFTEDKLIWKVLTGIFLALSALTRVTGLILLVVFFLVTFFQWIRRKKVNLSSFLLILFVIFLLLLPWMLRNGSAFGWSLSGILGLQGYSQLSKTFVVAPLLQLGIRAIVRFLFSFGYLILGAGILFGVFAILTLRKSFFREERMKIFLLISFLTILGFVLVTTKHGSGQHVSSLPFFLDYLLGGRIIGRYVDAALPILFILGSIGLTTVSFTEKNISKATFFVASLLGITSLVSVFSLFPVNNMSVLWLGLFVSSLQFLFFGTLETTFFSWLLLVFIAFFLFSLPFFFLYLSRKKWFTFKNIILSFTVFFLLLSLLNYGITFYNANTYWEPGAQNQVGKWLNSYDKDTDKIVLYDERDCVVRILKEDQRGICEPSHSATIGGFWINKEIIMGNVSHLDGVDYVMSMHELPLEKIYSLERIYVYKANV